MAQYLVTKSTRPEGATYGIIAWEDEKLIDTIEDLVPSWEETVWLAAMLEKNGVAAVHFRDVVEDYLAEANSL